MAENHVYINVGIMKLHLKPMTKALDIVSDIKPLYFNQYSVTRSCDCHLGFTA